MNKEKVSTSINQIEVPLEKLLGREKAAISKGKKKTTVKRTTKRSLLVACALIISLFGSGFVSTSMANALSNIPLIGSIYKDFRDIASEKIERDHLATMIDKQDSQNGITMTVKEAAYDGNRMMVSVMYTSDKDIHNLEGKSKVLINGQPIEVTHGSSGRDDIDEHTVIEHHQFTFSQYDEYGDKISVTVIGEEMFGYDNRVEVNFPLEKVEGQTTEFSPNVTSKSNDGIDGVYAITAERVIFSPLATRIDLKVDYPSELNENDKWPWFEYLVMDNTGKIYEGLKFQMGAEPGKFGHNLILILPPIDSPPASFTLMPRKANKEGKYVNLEELELVVPLK